MWTIENRPRYNRDKLRYPSDLTDAEWEHIKPLIPPAKRGGGKRRVNMREVVNGVMYVLSTGCQWRYIPKDLPPRSTVNDSFCLWSYDSPLENIHHALYVRCRERAEREANPTACILDSLRSYSTRDCAWNLELLCQSVKSAEKGVRASTRLGLMQPS
jgi:transposase